MIEILKGIEIVDLGLFLNKINILIVGDSHIGYEEELNKTGVLVPRFQYKELIERLKPILEKVKPEKIVLNGDISDEEWRNTLKLIDFLQGYGKLILIKGNHDTILGPIAKKRDIEIVDHYYEKGYYVCHGHKIPSDLDFNMAKTVIIGHEHPAVSIRDEIRSEEYKCFLKGKWKNKNLIVMPSLNLVTEGTDVLKEKLLSPFLTDISGFKVFVVGEKVYDFGKVRSLL